MTDPVRRRSSKIQGDLLLDLSSQIDVGRA
jgi:hypothetical protein